MRRPWMIGLALALVACTGQPPSPDRPENAVEWMRALGMCDDPVDRSTEKDATMASCGGETAMYSPGSDDLDANYEGFKAAREEVWCLIKTSEWLIVSTSHEDLVAKLHRPIADFAAQHGAQEYDDECR